MMENFVVLDEAGNPLPGLTHSESHCFGGPEPYHKSVAGFTMIMGFIAIHVDYLRVNKEEQDRLLHSIRAIREEGSGAVATREQIIDAVKADPEKFLYNLKNLFRALPELEDLKQKLRQEWGEELYLEYIAEEQMVPEAPTAPEYGDPKVVQSDYLITADFNKYCDVRRRTVGDEKQGWDGIPSKKVNAFLNEYLGREVRLRGIGKQNGVWTFAYQEKLAPSPKP